MLVRKEVKAKSKKNDSKHLCPLGSNITMMHDRDSRCISNLHCVGGSIRGKRRRRPALLSVVGRGDASVGRTDAGKIITTYTL